MNDRVPIRCSQLSAFDPSNWNDVRAAFAQAVELPLMQSWQALPNDRFQPGLVRAGWNADALWVLAELDDRAITGSESGFNTPAFLTGDAFEIFVRPAGQAAYCEFHVTPFNGQLQLRYPDAASVELVRKGVAEGIADPFAPFKVERELFESWTNIDSERTRWDVLARIPFASMTEAQGVTMPSRLDASFCRYDYTPGIRELVISSTSPHRAPNFHCQEEWAELVLV